MKIFNVLLLKFNKIKISLDNFTEFKSYKIQIENGSKNLSVSKYCIIDNDIIFTLNNDVDIKYETFIRYEKLYEKVHYFPLFSTREFNDKYYHDTALGATYFKDFTVFRVWSPAASYINLLLYDKSKFCSHENKIKIQMKESNGLWSTLVKGDLHGYYYNYEVNVYNKIHEVVDPYSKAVGINGTRGAILDMSQTNPQNWENDKSPEYRNYTDTIIYEVNIRDISTHPDSGIVHKGKFLGLTEDSTKSSKGISTCLNHIKELGITHIQFMPIFDFSYLSIDETNPIKYNWGYDPQNYNVPEGVYSTNSYDPACRILELKKMIQHLHKNNLSINMDVVYNHVHDAPNSSFEKIFPGYYFRFYDNLKPSNGSGCGNDIASEHSMARKFIIDSVIYWAKEYHIDGFRFDLMGLIDVDTMNLLNKKLNMLERPIMCYGEGWDLNTSLDKNLKAADYNVKILPGIGFFNNKIRDLIKGDVFNIEDRGFATGKPLLEKKLKQIISGYFLPPNQSINYISCHDNHTLWDKINLSCPTESFDNKKRMIKLCAAINLTSQGIPFIYSGEEFCNTKNGDGNSYNKPQHVNWVDWNRKYEFIDVFYYYKRLIHIRKNHPAFRINTLKDIENYLSFINNVPDNTIAYILKDYANGDSWKEILVIFNANKNSINISIPNGVWNIALDYNSKVENKTITGGNITVEKISTYILFKL